MARQSTSNVELDDVQLGIECTIMALRESFMRYFKGTCVDNLVTQNNVNLYYVDRPERYLYQRQQQERKSRRKVYLKNTHIGYVERAPNTLILRELVLHRSPELIKVREGILNFMGKYLSGVNIVHEGNDTIGTRSDTEIVLENKIVRMDKLHEEELIQMNEMLTWMPLHHGPTFTVENSYVHVNQLGQLRVNENE